MDSYKKIKVLHAIRQGKVGGGETHILNLVKHMDRDRFEPVVLSFTDGEMITELKNIGVGNFVIPCDNAFDFFKWKRVKDLMRKEEIDLVHIHGTRATSNTYPAARSLRLPTIYTIHGWSFHNDQPGLIKRARIVFEKWITKKTNCNISVSASNQKTGCENIPHFKSVVINNGIDLGKFDPDSVERKNLRPELKIAENAFVISFIGRVTGQKDPCTLIKAFKEVVADHPNAILLLAGDGDLKEKAMLLVKELQIEHSVVFENFRSDVPDVLFSSDVYCLPSLWEGLPIGLLEAMAMRKPVIATNVDGSGEIIRDNVNGVIIAPKNVQMLADSMIRLIRNKSLRAELGGTARKTVEEDFDVKKMAKKIENVYASVLSLN